VAPPHKRNDQTKPQVKKLKMGRPLTKNKTRGQGLTLGGVFDSKHIWWLPAFRIHHHQVVGQQPHWMNWVALQNHHPSSQAKNKTLRAKNSEINKSQKRCRSVNFARHWLKGNAICTLALQAPVYEMHNVDLRVHPTQEFWDQIRCIDIFIDLAWQLASTALNLPLLWFCCRCRRHFLALSSFLLKLAGRSLCHYCYLAIFLSLNPQKPLG